LWVSMHWPPRRPQTRRTPAPLIRDIRSVRPDSRRPKAARALSRQNFRHCHPTLKFGLGLIASGLEPSFVRSAIGHRLDGIASTRPIATTVSRAIGAGLMFTGATGAMLVEPNLVAMHPARFLILAIPCWAGWRCWGFPLYSNSARSVLPPWTASRRTC
jgi:hypothetical protein